MNPDLDLVLFDFVQAYRDHPERALAQLQLLLLDEEACRGRIALLEAAGEGAGPRPPRDFRAETDLLCDTGIFRAEQEGLLGTERLERLAQLTCDPVALWEAHRRLTAPGPEGADAPAGPGVPAAGAGLTEPARTGRWDKLASGLRPWLPFLLEHVGLGAGLADAFWDFVQARAPEVGERPFHDVLPGWLEEFARARGLSYRVPPLRNEDYKELTARGAVALVLGQARDDEPAWARDYRALARSRDLKSPGELGALEGTGALTEEPDLPAFRRHLAAEAERLRQEGLRLMD